MLIEAFFLGETVISVFEVLNRDDFAEKFKRFTQSATRNHPELRITPNTDVAWTPLTKPIQECTVALMTTAGVRKSNDRAFRNDSHWGDPSYRLIPADTNPQELVSDEVHVDTEAAHQDINCIFPITCIRKLAEEGLIGSVAPWHVSMLGFLPDPSRGLNSATSEITEKIKDSGADLVILTPG